VKIIVPLDLSDTAARAIDPATEIAKGLDDELLFVTVAGARLRTELHDIAEAEHASVPDIIEAHLKGVIADVAGIRAEHRMLGGDNAAEALIGFAQGPDIRMIVMATHGRSGVARWRLGSVAERVLRHADVPVMVVPTRSTA
jgi:nucleotide-binding universal stress UspA family protein